MEEIDSEGQRMDGSIHTDAAAAVVEHGCGHAQSSSSTAAAAAAAAGGGGSEGGSAAGIAAAASRRSEAGARGGAASHKGVPPNVLKMIETATFSKILSLTTEQDDKDDDRNLAGAASETRGTRADGQGDGGGVEDADEEERMCEICQSAYNKRDELLILPCKHYFHTGCVTKWLASHRTCPKCRHAVAPSGEDDEIEGAEHVAAGRPRLHLGAGNARAQGDEDVMDDLMDSWQTALAEGRAWGGRGAGGRGLSRRYMCMGIATRDVLVENLSLAYAGAELLSGCTLRLVHGRRYALLGRNGCGKTTLLHRIALGLVPGFPPHLTVALVAQEERMELPGGMSVVEWLVGSACSGRKRCLGEKRQAMEERLDELEASDSEAMSLAEQLGDIDSEIEELEGGAAMELAARTLSGLGFTDEAMHNQTPSMMSGGWRMRVQIAKALLSRPDILLLDEPTNHLDLHGVLWLEGYLSRGAGFGMALVVSHDRDFQCAVATDVLMFESKSLRSFAGGLEEFEAREEQVAARNESMLDARVRQEKMARESAAEMQKQARRHAKGGFGDGQLKQAKQKLDKISRIGLFRDDGRRYKLQSLNKLDPTSVRLPSRIEAQAREREEIVSFPPPNASALRCSPDSPIISLEAAACGHGHRLVLSNVSLQISMQSRIAVVGDNGSGKTSLLALLADELEHRGSEGGVTRRPGLSVAYVRQHHVEALREHRCMTPAEYLSHRFGVSEHDARSRLGKFGLSGGVAVTPLSKLSGGQRVRVSLTAITWDDPQVLLLDEPTNHLDMQGISALAAGVRDYGGGVVVVSHNRAFCNACCTSLWVVKDGGVEEVRADEGLGFAEVFGDYAQSVVLAGGREGPRSRAAAADGGGRSGWLGGSAAERTGMF